MKRRLLPRGYAVLLVLLAALFQAGPALAAAGVPAQSTVVPVVSTPAPLRPIFASMPLTRTADGWNNQIGTYNGLPVVAPSGTPPPTMPCTMGVPPLLGTSVIIVATAVPPPGTTAIPECAMGGTAASNGPLNPPCSYQGIIIGTPPGVVVGTPPPATPIVATTPITGVIPPAPTPVYVPMCQFPQQNVGNCDGWQFNMPLDTSFCIPYKGWIKDVLGAALHLFDTTIGAAVQRLINDVVAAISGTPDLSGVLGDFYTVMSNLAQEILLLLFTLEATRLALAIVTSLHYAEALGSLRRVIWALAMVHVLPDVLPLWISVVNAIAGDITSKGGNAFGDVVAASLLAANTDPVLGFIFFVLLLMALFVVVIAVVQRVVGLFMLACLYAVAPACVACWIAPETRPIARWWFGSFLAYSLYGVAYALVFKIDGSLLASSPFSTDPDHIMPFFMGLGGLFALLRIPHIMDTLQAAVAGGSGVTSGAAGIAVATETTATVIQRVVR